MGLVQLSNLTNIENADMENSLGALSGVPLPGVKLATLNHAMSLQDLIHSTREYSKSLWLQIIWEIVHAVRFYHDLGFLVGQITCQTILIDENKEEPSNFSVFFVDKEEARKHDRCDITPKHIPDYYVAPEIRYSSSGPSLAANIYSLGAVFRLIMHRPTIRICQLETIVKKCCTYDWWTRPTAMDLEKMVTDVLREERLTKNSV